MRDFFAEMGFKLDKPTMIDQDNMSVIAIAANPIHHARIKHMEVKARFVQEKMDKKVVDLIWCPTELMLADILTKALAVPDHTRLVKAMGMRKLSDILENGADKEAIKVMKTQMRTRTF